ncbi:hypothetical protein, partial [Lacticaseibacillus paracasei]|uniref:hypothetical protein n=1 Tax=Lacticaseibacillus paracasei TaxID=1597 RepID=UPI0021A3D519
KDEWQSTENVMQVKILSSSRVTHVNPLKVDAIIEPRFLAVSIPTVVLQIGAIKAYILSFINL